MPDIMRVGTQVTTVKPEPQAADRALMADVQRLLARLRAMPSPDPEPSHASSQPHASSRFQRPSSRLQEHSAAARTCAAAGGARLTMHADWLPADAPQPSLGVAVQARASPSPSRVEAGGCGTPAQPGGRGSVETSSSPDTLELPGRPAAPAELEATGADGPSPGAADVGEPLMATRPAAPAPFPGKAGAAEESMQWEGGAPPPAGQAERWVMIISDDADFGATLRAVACAGCRTMSVGDRAGAGSCADVCLSWQEVQGLPPF